MTPDNLPWQQPDNLHIQAIVKGHIKYNRQSSEGIGILEQLALGPHAPSGGRTFSRDADLAESFAAYAEAHLPGAHYEWDSIHRIHGGCEPQYLQLIGVEDAQLLQG